MGFLFLIAEKESKKGFLPAFPLKSRREDFSGGCSKEKESKWHITIFV